MASHYSDEQLRVLEKQAIECKDVVKLLGDYADRELPTSLRARVDAHVDTCEVCQEERRTYLQTIALAHELQHSPVGIEIQNRLREALTRRLGIQIPPVA